MREDVANIDHLPAVLDHRDEPVFVAADIENGKDAYRIGMPEIFAHIHETLPRGALGDQIPMHQRLQGVFVNSCELGNGRLADDPHLQFGNLPSNARGTIGKAGEIRGTVLADAAFRPPPPYPRNSTLRANFTAGFSLNCASTLSGTSPSVDTIATASDVPSRRPNAKFAILMLFFPSTVPTCPITPGTS